MWGSKGYGGKKEEGKGLVAVAIDKEKGSQTALRWAIDNILCKTRPVVLIHVINNPSLPAGTSSVVSIVGSNTSPNQDYVDKQTKELFLTFRCFCSRKDIRCIDVTLKDSDVGKALSEYVHQAVIESLVLGNSRSGFFKKLKQADVPSIVLKGVPDFCTVYVISKSSRISSVRNAARPIPHASPLYNQLESVEKDTKTSTPQLAITPPRLSLSAKEDERTKRMPQRDNRETVRSDRLAERLMFSDFPEGDTDISFVGSERTSIDHLSSPLHYDYMDSARTSRVSTSSDRSYGSLGLGQRPNHYNLMQDHSFMSHESGRPSTSSASSHHNEEVENEMRRLKLELKQTMDMYSEACKEAVLAKEREQHTTAVAERKKANSNAGLERKRTAPGSTDEDISSHCVGNYRKYSIQEIEEATNHFSKALKIGEGGYGPVYKCYLDHTRVAVKVLRPDAAQGMTQFQQEVEVLSCIRHPNMVLLLGACPEYGCLVYEYMANGSLDDRLFCEGNSRPLSWQTRFRIASEVATGLHFLHQTKPEPLVHRDLKPGNILLDRYFVSKISDVGLARLVPPSVANNITQYRMTSTAGTFCYIDPEYQQTGMLGVKSDVYSLGVVLLQLLTAKPPMGLAHKAESHIEGGTFANFLDPSILDWPVEEALCIAKIAVQCADMRRKNRPDLGQVVLPEFARLRDFADDRSQPFMFYANPSPVHSRTSISQDYLSDPILGHSIASSTGIADGT